MEETMEFESEAGTLPVGIEHKGARQREFTLKPLTVGDLISAADDRRSRGNEYYMSVVLLARQITRLGDIPKEEITPELLVRMDISDLAALNEASIRLRQRREHFRGEAKGNA